MNSNKINNNKINNIKYAWYSEKQLKILKRNNKLNKERKFKPYIYYINNEDKIIQITEITHDNKSNPNFKDVIFKGIVKKFYKSSDISLL